MTALPSARELLHIQLRTLWSMDALGRLDPEPKGGNTVPRIFITTADGARVIRIRQDVSELTARSWLACASDADLRAHVVEHGPVVREYRGPAYILPDFRDSAYNAIDLGAATVRFHPELVGRGWKPAESPPYFGLVRDNVVVSVCFSAASSDEAAEAGVETVEAYRGQGLVVEVVRAWAGAVQTEGRLALYSTTWENLASQRVAEKLGGVRYGENWHLT